MVKSINAQGKRLYHIGMGIAGVHKKGCEVWFLKVEIQPQVINVLKKLFHLGHTHARFWNLRAHFTVSKLA